MEQNKNKRKFRKWKLLFIPLGLGLVAGMGWIVMSLWNCLIPEIFHLQTISFWQALGLFALSRILFGKFHFNKGGKHRGGFNQEMRDKCWDKNFDLKNINLSEEEKTSLKREWKDKWKEKRQEGGNENEQGK